LLEPAIVAGSDLPEAVQASNAFPLVVDSSGAEVIAEQPESQD